MTTHDAAVAPGGRLFGGRGLGAAGKRLAFAGMAALALGAVKINRPPRLSTLCALRGMTGIPCPACGSTTAFTRLGQGRVVDALLANPFALLLALALVVAPLGVFARFSRASQRTTWVVVLAVTAASWGWQVVRYA